MGFFFSRLNFGLIHYCCTCPSSMDFPKNVPKKRRGDIALTVRPREGVAETSMDRSIAPSPTPVSRRDGWSMVKRRSQATSEHPSLMPCVPNGTSLLNSLIKRVPTYPGVKYPVSSLTAGTVDSGTSCDRGCGGEISAARFRCLSL